MCNKSIRAITFVQFHSDANEHIFVVASSCERDRHADTTKLMKQIRRRHPSFDDLNFSFVSLSATRIKTETPRKKKEIDCSEMSLILSSAASHATRTFIWPFSLFSLQKQKSNNYWSSHSHFSRSLHKFLTFDRCAFDCLLSNNF